MPIHAEDLRRLLSETAGRPITLKINDNTHTLISTKRDGAGPGLRVSIHRMFLDAEDVVIDAVARFVSKPDDEARHVVREFISMHHEKVASGEVIRPTRVIRGTARGQVVNLEERARAIHSTYFRSDLRYRIIWGKSIRAGMRQRHITLGTWNSRQQIIRIHPILDHPLVPHYFRDFIIYHEMVHIAVPSSVDGRGYMIHHSPEFRAVERQFADYTRAMQWEKKWLSKLIKEWNGGRPLPQGASS